MIYKQLLDPLKKMIYKLNLENISVLHGHLQEKRNNFFNNLPIKETNSRFNEKTKSNQSEETKTISKTTNPFLLNQNSEKKCKNKLQIIKGLSLN